MNIEDFKLLREARVFAQFFDLAAPIKEALFRVIDAGPQEVTPEEQKDIDLAIQLAIDECGCDDINIDSDAKVSFADDGAWVQAWVYVSMKKEDEELELEPVESEGGHCD